MEQLQNTWNEYFKCSEFHEYWSAQKRYDALWFFWAFRGVNNNTKVYTQYRIWIGLVRPIHDLAEDERIRANTDTRYRIGASLVIYCKENLQYYTGWYTARA